jgi:hypothetical protein
MKSVNQPRLLGGVPVVKAAGRMTTDGPRVSIGATPYYAWANRGPGHAGLDPPAVVDL